MAARIEGNTNRLLHQYFPKGTDLSIDAQTDLNRITRQFNERPIKTLDYESPAERFDAARAMVAESNEYIVSNNAGKAFSITIRLSDNVLHGSISELNSFKFELLEESVRIE